VNVLFGDQNQLPKPVRGTHDGDSGKASLVYFLNGEVVIPPHLGFFLDVTRRMHPELTQIISELFYNGRLKAHPSTAFQRVHLPSESDDLLIKKEKGLVFFPVITEDNRQANTEEIDAIEKIVKELIGRDITERISDTESVTRKLELVDIVIVAPYNLQADLLKERLGPTARVGTIDEFQGQEAMVSIVSMTDSRAEYSSRGKAFLLSKNRMNVAISRAKALAIVVGNPDLVGLDNTTLADMEMANMYKRIKRLGTQGENPV
jgi:superfamily I DNA and/or RNA helicase